MEGKGETCKWSVDAVCDKGFGGPVAHDPYGNYYFYLTIQSDGMKQRYGARNTVHLVAMLIATHLERSSSAPAQQLQP